MEKQGARTLVVLDNGAYMLRAGFASNVFPVRVLSNCIARHRGLTLVGDEVDSAGSGCSQIVRRPFEMGYLVDHDVEEEIWRRAFGPVALNISKFEDSALFVTEPFFTPRAIKANVLQLVFKRFGFCEAFVVPSAYCALRSCLRDSPKRVLPEQYDAETEHARARTEDFHLIIDCGYSFTHVIPFCKRRVMRSAVRRLDVGGKLLTNYLKESVSFRQFNVSKQSRVMDSVKTRACFVSLDYSRDLALCKSASTARRVDCPLRIEVALPDGVTATDCVIVERPPVSAARVSGDSGNSGAAVGSPASASVVKPKSAASKPETAESDSPSAVSGKSAGELDLDRLQLLTLDFERIATPELLFHPSDIGLGQGGIVDAIVECLEACHPACRATLLRNIFVVGGSTRFPGFAERMFVVVKPVQDLVSRTRGDSKICVFVQKKPELSAFRGLAALAHGDVATYRCTKQEYDRLGAAACIERMECGWAA